MNTPSFFSRRRAIGLTGALALVAFSGCDRQSASPATPRQIVIRSSAGPESPAGSFASQLSGPPLATLYKLVTEKMVGFQSGNSSSGVGMVVVFDPQCPHCGKVWVESSRLAKEVNFAWIPVPMMNKQSTEQGAMLLGSTDPIADMNKHEELLLSGKGGLAMDMPVYERGVARIETNRQLATDLKIDAVPLILFRKANGEILSTVGGVRAEELVVMIQS